MIRRFVYQWLTCRDRNKPSGRSWARQLGTSHTWLQKLVREFREHSEETQREMGRHGDPALAQLSRAREHTQRMRERGDVLSSGVEQQVGRELGVRAIFKGRLTQRGDNLAISAELIDAQTDDHMWGQQHRRKASDIFTVQQEVAKEMASALRMRLSGEDEKRLAKSYTANPDAYQDYLKGLF